MTQYDPWVSYGGAARIWLALGLLAVAGGLVYAGIRLPVPARPARPGKKAAIVMLVAWAAAIVALLAGVAIYIRHYLQEYQGIAGTPPPDRVAPVTFAAVVVVFVIIFTRSPRDSGPRLASAAIGAIAAPFIFELPFDLIIMARVHSPIPPGPALYMALLFALLLLVDITTLLLLRLSPMVRLTRATFYSLALMLGVFAIWALAGFGYPSAPVPLTLNIVSKLLAFATALTLFFPQRPPPEQAPQPNSSEQARPPSPPLALDSTASAEIADDPQLTGQPARSSVRGVVRPRCRLLAGAACGILVLALVTAGCSSAGRPAGALAKTPGQAAGPLWLCQPGQAPDPCADNPAVSAVTASGTVSPAARPSSAAASLGNLLHDVAGEEAAWQSSH
jgi:hypothetical protein